MENDHPRAMDFLRMDCRNVTSFFKKKGAQPAAARSLFDFVIDSDMAEESQEDRLKVSHTQDPTTKESKHCTAALLKYLLWMDHEGVVPLLR